MQNADQKICSLNYCLFYKGSKYLVLLLAIIYKMLLKKMEIQESSYSLEKDRDIGKAPCSLAITNDILMSEQLRLYLLKEAEKGIQTDP